MCACKRVRVQDLCLRLPYPGLEVVKRIGLQPTEQRSKQEMYSALSMVSNWVHFLFTVLLNPAARSGRRATFCLRLCVPTVPKALLYHYSCSSPCHCCSCCRTCLQLLPTYHSTCFYDHLFSKMLKTATEKLIGKPSSSF